ncbi:phosphotransferase enzyme family protein [Streptomyces sp. NRRL S-1824]|uniref:phosphotransferase enzyme family protein n=1 Tax=Streptomyces sp. NRRL S-1824 TaxID=1463889 RepID=UPI001900EE97|nr:aminoglycoside phosphotransferase family protein [Streptomyces sp. NRRL S-1824]
MAVIDRPPIDERTLTAEVAQAWGLDGVEFVFLPIGLDGQAWAYRINTAGEDGYFMKVRRGEFAPAAVSLPQYLREQGLTHVVAPRGTRSGEAGHAMGGSRMLLYPFHGGGNLWSRGLTDRQWIEYGAFLGKLHSTVPSPRIESILPVENYSTTAPARVHARSAEAAVSNVLGAFWQRYGAAITRLCETVDELAAKVTAGPHVICHADVHPGNLIADGDGPLHVVDWDAPIMAPRERDLMFVLGQGFGEHPVSPRQEALFCQGYGPLQINDELLTFYRQERSLDDIAEFLSRILDPETSPEARANDLHWLTRNAEMIT